MLSRLLLAAMAMEIEYGKDQSLAHPGAVILFLWAVTTLAMMVGWPSINPHRFVGKFVVDVIVASLASWFAPTTLPCGLLLVLASSQLLLRAGYSPKLLLALLAPLMLAVISAGLAGDTVLGLGFSAAGLLISTLSVVNSIIAVAISASRADQLRGFAEQANSLHMLRLERSLEFDLQGLTDAMAKLFLPQRAYCLFDAAAQNAAHRRFEHGLSLDLSIDETQVLIDHSRHLADGSRIMDLASNRFVAVGSYAYQGFDHAERRVASILSRQGISIALLRPLRIGRSHGLAICVLNNVDIPSLYEAGLIDKALEELVPLLDRVAEAERHFIADAHDVARRDLHDGVMQTLAAVRMQLLSIGRRDDLKKLPAQREIEKVADILTIEQARLRGLLETSEDDDHGINLVTRLDVGLRSISMQWEIDAKLESAEPAIPTDKESAINIEHLVREAVANAVRHANSTQLTVRLSVHHNALQIAIIDRANPANDRAQKRGENSMPLKSASLLHRLRLVNGSAYAEGLDSSTILAVTIPLQRIDNA
jgi:signal transduction histidine kinase